MAKKKLTIRPLQICQMEGVQAVMTYLVGFDKEMKAGAYMFFIEGADKAILVDTSGSAESLKAAGFSATQIASPEEALSKLGLTCDDIDIVIFTHLHFDHVEYAPKFKKAKFICQSAELREALHPHPGIDSILYWPHLYQDLKFVTITGDQEISDGIRVMLTPGHSPGGQTVLVETEKGIAAITGLCSIMENYFPPEPYDKLMGVITPGIHDNSQEAIESVIMIKHVADIIVPIHDIKWSTVNSIP
jgi:glyoxylase-like metal-dependent hydrolase (beta-lactamase superfamily II)